MNEGMLKQKAMYEYDERLREDVMRKTSRTSRNNVYKEYRE